MLYNKEVVKGSNSRFLTYWFNLHSLCDVPTATSHLYQHNCVLFVLLLTWTCASLQLANVYARKKKIKDNIELSGSSS
jgi:uncharacterized membrane protein YhfC